MCSFYAVATQPPAASWAFPLSITAKQPPRNRPPAVLDMSEFPALGTTPANTSNSGHNNYAISTGDATPAINTLATGTITSSNAYVNAVSQHVNHVMQSGNTLNHGNAASGSSLFSSASGSTPMTSGGVTGFAAAAAAGITSNNASASGTQSPVKQRKAGEFTLEDFPALGHDTTSSTKHATQRERDAEHTAHSESSGQPTAAQVVNGNFVWYFM
jgi:hypothetical protein